MKTFREWLVKEGLWLSDGNAEQTSGGVRAQRKSKPAQGGSGGGGGMAAAGPAPGLSLPPGGAGAAPPAQ